MADAYALLRLLATDRTQATRWRDLACVLHELGGSYTFRSADREMTLDAHKCFGHALTLDYQNRDIWESAIDYLKSDTAARIPMTFPSSALPAASQSERLRVLDHGMALACAVFWCPNDHELSFNLARTMRENSINSVESPGGTIHRQRAALNAVVVSRGPQANVPAQERARYYAELAHAFGPHSGEKVDLPRGVKLATKALSLDAWCQPAWDYLANYMPYEDVVDLGGVFYNRESCTLMAQSVEHWLAQA